MSTSRVPLLFLALAAAVLGGSPPLAAQEEPKEPKPKRVCINRSEINVIKPLDGQHAFVKLSAGRHYLFTLDKTCQEFKLARQITISDGTRVCNDGLTMLTYQYPSLGTLRCRIDQLDRVPDEAAAWELIESRRPPQ